MLKCWGFRLIGCVGRWLGDDAVFFRSIAQKLQNAYVGT